MTEKERDVPIRFDHLVHWVPELTAAVAAYNNGGLHTAMGGKHPGWGTHNALCHFGLQYIEIIAFHDKEQAGSGPSYVMSHGERLVDEGGGAINFALAVQDLDATRRRLTKLGIDVGESRRGQRVRPDGSRVSWQLAPLLSGPKWRPFLIQWGRSDGDRWADLRARGIDAPHEQGRLTVVELMIVTSDPAADASWCERMIGGSGSLTRGSVRVSLPGCDLLFATPEEANVKVSPVPRIAQVTLGGGKGFRLHLAGLTIASSEDVGDGKD